MALKTILKTTNIFQKNNFLKNKKEIIDWLDRYQVENYTLVEDLIYGYAVNVEGDVHLNAKKFKFIPVKFNEVKGNFYCNANQLTSLEFSPTTVGSFNCYHNELVSLEFCPRTVNGDFFCQYNQLTSLEFCPEHIRGHFDCSNNKLTSLEFCPTTVKDSFYCQNNNIRSLEFCPTSVGINFFCLDNPALGDNQDIEDFQHIFNTHQEIIIKNEKEKIEKLLKKFNIKDVQKKRTLKI